MNKQEEYIDLFPTRVYHFKIENNDEFKEKYLSDMILKYENKEYSRKYTYKWNTHNVHSSFGSPDKIIKSIPKEYVECFKKVFCIKWSGKFTWWHNVYKNQEYQELHGHYPADFSAIHFLSFDKSEHHAPIFYDPARLIKQSLPSTCVPCREIAIDVDEGSFIIFPSFLEHLVQSNFVPYKKHRVTVSVNLQLNRDV
jgi:hypothetical protein